MGKLLAQQTNSFPKAHEIRQLSSPLLGMPMKAISAPWLRLRIRKQRPAELLALKFKLDPATCALNGGEDYELLFTIDPADVEKVKYLPEIYIAGEILDAKDGIKLNTKGGNLHDLKAQGWVHF